jgi:hypothetical protein
MPPANSQGNFVGVRNPGDDDINCKLAHTPISGPWPAGTCFEVEVTAKRDHCKSSSRPTKSKVHVQIIGWADGPEPIVDPLTDDWSHRELFKCTLPVFTNGGDPGEVTRTLFCCSDPNGRDIAFVTWTIAGVNQRHNTYVTFDCVPPPV